MLPAKNRTPIARLSIRQLFHTLNEREGEGGDRTVCKSYGFHGGIVEEHAAYSCRVDMNVNMKTKASADQTTRYLRTPHPETCSTFSTVYRTQATGITSTARQPS